MGDFGQIDDPDIAEEELCAFLGGLRDSTSNITLSGEEV